MIGARRHGLNGHRQLVAWLGLALSVGGALVGLTWKLGREIDQKAPVVQFETLEETVGDLRSDVGPLSQAVKDISATLGEIKIEQRDQRELLLTLVRRR